MDVANQELNKLRESIEHKPGEKAKKTPVLSRRQTKKLIQRELKKPDDTQFRTTDFGVKDSGVGKEMRDKSGGQHERLPEYSGLTRERKLEYMHFLKEHVTDLARMYREDPTLFEGEEQDLALLKHLIGKNASGVLLTDLKNADNAKLLDEHIAEFLGTSGGYIHTTKIMDHRNFMEGAAEGLISETNPGPAEDVEPGKVDKIPLGMGEGPLGYPARKLQEFLATPTASFKGRKGKVSILGTYEPWEWWGIPRGWTGGKKDPATGKWTGGAKIGFNFHEQNRLMTGALLVGTGAAIATAEVLTLGFATFGLAGIAVAAGLPTGFEAVALAVGKGLSVDNKKSPTALDFIKSDPHRLKYIKAMTGIDVLHPESMSTVQRDLLRKQIQARIETRQKFFDEIHADQTAAEATSWGYLLNPTGKGNPEKVGLDWMTEATERFNAAGGAIDSLNRNRYIPNPDGIMVENPDFMTGGATVKYRETLERRNETDKVLMMKDLQGFIDAARKEELPKEATWDARINAINSPDAKTALAKDLQTQKDTLTTDKGLLSPEVAGFKTYNDTLKANREIRDEAMSKFGVSDIKGIDQEILKRTRGLTDAKYVGYQKELAKLDAEWKALVTAEQTPLLAKYTDAAGVINWAGLNKEVGDNLASRKAGFALREAELKDRLETKVKTEREDLKRLRQLIVDKQNELSETGRVTQSVSEKMAELQSAYSDVSSWNGAGGAALADADLQTKTFDELLSEINKANTGGGGWPKERNDKPENRKKLYRAIIEAKAREVESQPANAPYITLIGVMATSGISENQLRMLSLDAVMKLVNDDYIASSGMRGWSPASNATHTAQMETLLEKTKDRLKTRIDVVDTQTKEMGEIDEVLSDRIKDIDAVIAEKRNKLVVAKNIGKNFNNIIERRFEIAAEVGRFTDRTTISGDKTYTAAERSAQFGTPPTSPGKGYYEMLDLLFDYKKHTGAGGIPDREAYFNIISSIVTPDRLMQIMRDSLGTHLPAVTNFDDFLDKFKTQIDSRQIREAEIRPALLAIIDAFNDEGEAV